MIEVPEAFAAIGYSGFFHTIATFPDQATRDVATARAPYLVGNSGWMVLRVNDQGDAVMVRRDSAAIIDVCTIPPAGKAIP
jgi:hypothetical protein